MLYGRTFIPKSRASKVVHSVLLASLIVIAMTAFTGLSAAPISRGNTAIVYITYFVCEVGSCKVEEVRYASSSGGS